MTAQLPDKVLYEGEEYVTFDEPLSSLGELPEFMDLSTGNIKGYFSVWVFVADRFFVVSLRGYVPGKTGKGLGLVFPDVQEPVFASWYSGKLKLLGGKLLSRSDIWPIYEREILLEVKDGVIQGSTLLDRTGEPVRHEYDSALILSIECLEGLACEVIDSVRDLGVSRLGDLVQFDGLELAKMAGLSIDSVIEIRKALSVFGLSFGMSLQGWPPMKGSARSL